MNILTFALDDIHDEERVLMALSIALRCIEEHSCYDTAGNQVCGVSHARKVARAEDTINQMVIEIDPEAD
jgi:hypothetical protein